MKSIVLISFILCVSLTLFKSTEALSDFTVQDLWNSFKKEYRKTYLSLEHEAEKFKIFRKHVEQIDKHNAEYGMGIHKYTLGINEYTDWTFEEFKERLLGLKVNNTQMRKGSVASFRRLPSEIQTPKSIDWREKNAVTPVKDQGQCGSCWSFSTTGSLEGAHARAFNKLVSLSEQQLVDCSGKYGNQGCNGGLMDNAFTYIKENGGLESEESYPYKATEGKCHFDKSKVVATCTGYVDVPEGDEEALKEALATIGPVSVAIDATQENFMMYKSGVFVDDSCSNKEDSLDHGVLAVGYGTDEDGSDFWIVKNSWGPGWGEDGYIRMARNKDNMCGIATSASYPLVK